MMVLGGENTNLSRVRKILIEAMTETSNNSLLKNKESEDTFNDVLLDGVDVFLCLAMSKGGRPKEEVMRTYKAIPDSVKLQLGNILLFTTEGLLLSKEFEDRININVSPT